MNQYAWRPFPMRPSALSAFYVVLLASMALGTGQPTTGPSSDVAVLSTAGQLIHPLTVAAPDKAVVLLFIATDCPISNGYAPTIAETAQAFAGQGVQFYLVYSDPTLLATDAQKHQARYRLPGIALLDPAQQLAKAVGATVTPEAMIVTPGGAIAYDGPIDDQFAAIGRKRFNVGKHYLADALTAVLAGKKVENQRVTPVGCGM